MHVSKELFRSLSHDLFTRLQSPRKKLLGKRQLEILNTLLSQGDIEFFALFRIFENLYKAVANPRKAFVRDLNSLLTLGAIKFDKSEKDGMFNFAVRLEWPSEITESKFFEKVKEMPKAKMHSFLSAF